MPVMIINRASQVTLEQYEAIRDRVGWREVPPAGAISHAISFTDTGALEVNVFESEELYDTYFRDRLEPALKAAGLKIDDTQILEAQGVAVAPPAYDHMLPLRREPSPVPEGRVIALYRRRHIPSDLYDSFRAAAPIDTVPDGALAHAYGRTDDDDIVTIDVWEDGRAMFDYIKQVVIPAVHAQGVDFYWPEIVELRTFLTTPAARAHEKPFEAKASALESAN